MKISVLSSIDQVPPSEWNALVPPGFPFMDHEFLSALERGGCLGPAAGWEPCHLSAWEGTRLVGACCLYRKSHSYGEYIFDWEWASAFKRYRIDYYPKLTSAVPFTPATGKKLLTLPGADQSAIQNELLDHAIRETSLRQASSLHFLFIAEDEIPVFESLGFHIRHSFQFHWTNRGYRDFDDFLSRMKSKRRKEILRERRKVKEQDISIDIFRGDEIEIGHARMMCRFYLSTIDKKWGSAYLTEDFFLRIHANMRGQLVMIMAAFENRVVAGSIHFHKDDCLYGRYWGCLRDFQFLHFEVCYYKALEYAISNGVRLFEAGAQGGHKVQRGFLPQLTYSAHRIEHRGFDNAIAGFLEDEKRALYAGLAEGNYSPFRIEPG